MFDRQPLAHGPETASLSSGIDADLRALVSGLPRMVKKSETAAGTVSAPPG